MQKYSWVRFSTKQNQLSLNINFFASISHLLGKKILSSLKKSMLYLLINMFPSDGQTSSQVKKCLRELDTQIQLKYKVNCIFNFLRLLWKSLPWKLMPSQTLLLWNCTNRVYHEFSSTFWLQRNGTVSEQLQNKSHSDKKHWKEKRDFRQDVGTSSVTVLGKSGGGYYDLACISYFTKISPCL